MCCVLLAACPGTEENTGSATAATTTGAGPTTDDGTTTGGPATSTTGDEPTGGDATADVTGGTAPPETTGVTGDPMTDCDLQYAELAKQLDKDCSCLIEAGDFPDEQACIAELGMEPADCVCPILAGDPANAGWLACIVVAEQAYTACTAAIACSDFEAYVGCGDAYFEASMACGTVTKQTFGETEVACYDTPTFMCGSGESVPITFSCDNEPDCMDMSDEAEESCSFTCDDGQKIPKDEACDGAPNCMDMSDEAEELCVFTCMDGEEIPKSWMCDEEPDCNDGSDEAMCLGSPLKRRPRGWSAGKHRTPSPAARATRPTR